MGRMPWATYLWPGLPQLWQHGAWSALAIAAGAAVLVNVALVATLLWYDLFSPSAQRGLWFVVAGLWTVAAAYSYFGERRRTTERMPAGPDPFPRAVDHYLKAEWFEAESLLLELLRNDPNDPDAGLMLASLFRHTKRYEEAARQLDRVEQGNGAWKWGLEIQREREWLDQARQATPLEPSDVSPAGSQADDETANHAA